MATLERAIELAARAHAGQLDKAGELYIIHPIKVMLRVHGEAERIVAMLHDVVEDTPVTLDDLRAEGFSDLVLEAVQALTKITGESRIDAAHRAANNTVARQVKLADNAENRNMSRIPNPTAADYMRLEEYKCVREILLAKEPS